MRVPLAQYLHEPLSNVTRELIGSFKVRCVADGKAEQLFKLDKRNADDKDGYEHLQVKDGCGFIHEDLYRQLVGDPNAPLPPHAADPTHAAMRPLVPSPLPTDLASDALHHYPYQDGRSARPMVQEVLNRIKNLLGKPMGKDGSDDPAVEVSRKKAKPLSFRAGW